MPFLSYDGWLAHDPAWDHDARRGPFCIDCGTNLSGTNRGGYACICGTCKVRRAKEADHGR
jgi:hypothetical protein